MTKANTVTMVSQKARKAILQLVRRDRKRRTPEVLARNALRAEKAVGRLAKSRRDAERRNEHLLAQKASV